MKIATWNIERLKHKADIDKMYASIKDVAADILVLTETDSSLHPEYKYCYATPLLAEHQPDYYAKTENRVTVYSDYPCIRQYDTYDDRTAIAVELETGFDNLIVYGTIMGIFGNREKSFKTDIVQQMEDIRRISATGGNICVIGDYNLTFCDNYYFTSFGRNVVNEAFDECGVEIVTKDREECIDHIALSRDFYKGKTIVVDEWNYERSLSDHKGIVVEII